MSELNKETINRLLELGVTNPTVNHPKEGDPYIVIPSGMNVAGLAAMFPPARIKSQPALRDAESFVAYVNRFKTDNTMVFADLTLEENSIVGALFVAILDYHGPAPELKAARCNHMATFRTLNTPEWLTWMEMDRENFGQVEFAEWLEENLRLFTKPEGSSAPSGAELLELVQSLHGHANARFTGTTRLQTGAYSASFEEDIEVRGGGSALNQDKVALPKEVVAGIAPFQGGPAYEVHARMKVRVTDRRLTLRLETADVPKIIMDSIILLLQQVEAQTGIKPLLGAV